MQSANYALAWSLRNWNNCENRRKLVVFLWHGVSYPDSDSRTYEWQTRIALLSPVWTNVGLLSYACNIQGDTNGCSTWNFVLVELIKIKHTSWKLGTKTWKIMTESGSRLVLVMTALRVWDGVKWMDCHSDHKYRLQRLLLVVCQFSESVWWETVTVSLFISIHVSREQRKIQNSPVLMKLPHSLGPWCSLNW